MLLRDADVTERAMDIRRMPFARELVSNERLYV